MKKLLITGSAGFLGSRIVDFYHQKYEICAPTHRELDITNEENVIRVFRKWKPDIVIHCAAVSDVGLCGKEPEKSYKINVEGSISVAKAAGTIHAKCILCSSDQVYFGISAKDAHNEEEELCPIPVYGQQKYRAEQECLRENPDCVVLRLSWMYDTRTMREGEHGDFFRKLLAEIKGTGELFYPVYDRRGITDVNEVVKNLEEVFQIPGGVYNFGAFNDKNTYDLIHEIFEKAGFDTSRLRRNEEAFRENPRNICMRQDKINSCGIFFSSTKEGLIRNLTLPVNSNGGQRVCNKKDESELT